MFTFLAYLLAFEEVNAKFYPDLHAIDFSWTIAFPFLSFIYTNAKQVSFAFDKNTDGPKFYSF